MIAPQAVGHLARYLAAHPEGVTPNGFPFRDIAQSCEDFVELTGKIGDVSTNLTLVSSFFSRTPFALTLPCPKKGHLDLVWRGVCDGMGPSPLTRTSLARSCSCTR